MEDLIRRVDPNYQVTTFRAGGYLIEPFNKIKDAFDENDIRIDSSVCPDIFNDYGIFSFDFCFYPNKLKYNFEYTPKDIAQEGCFVEVPITTVKIPAYINIFLTLIRIIKYRNIESERKGSGVGEYFGPNRPFYRKLFSLLKPRINQLTTDSNFKERFSYVFKKVPEYSKMIIHPKLLNSHTIELLDDYVSTNKIRFISIQNLLP